MNEAVISFDLGAEWEAEVTYKVVQNRLVEILEMDLTRTNFIENKTVVFTPQLLVLETTARLSRPDMTVFYTKAKEVRSQAQQYL